MMPAGTAGELLDIMQAGVPRLHKFRRELSILSSLPHGLLLTALSTTLGQHLDSLVHFADLYHSLSQPSCFI
jgi:hypothetical protein